MTDTTKAPERIWRVAAWTPSQHKHGLASWPVEEHAGKGSTEYIRKDVSDALIAAAQEEAFREAARFHQEQQKRWQSIIDADETPISHNRFGSLVANHSAYSDAILALITKDQANG
jgi:hypothetical protein